jgi:sporulation protein YlmC with PRC-barrel domain
LTWFANSATQDEKKRPGTDTPGVYVKGGSHFHKATDIIGTKVKNPQGEDLGKIEELVLNPNEATVEYAVLSFGGFLGMGDKLFAIPFTLLAMPGMRPVDASSERDKDKNADGEKRQDPKTTDGMGTKEHKKPAYFVLNIDKERLKKATGFPKDNWPDIHTSQWRSEIDTYYGVPKRRASGDPGQAIDSNREFKLCKVSELYGKNVYNVAGDKVGDVKDLVIDHGQGRVHCAVVAASGKLLAVPWGAMKHQKDGDTEKVVLDLSKERLERAPEIKDSDWAKLYDPSWCRELYSYYGVKPPAKDAPADTGATRPRKE